MAEHPVGVTPGAYNRRVMSVNVHTGPDVFERERSGRYYGVFGVSAGALRRVHCTGLNY